MEKIAADLLLKGLAPEGFADSQPIGLVTTDSSETGGVTKLAPRQLNLEFYHHASKLK